MFLSVSSQFESSADSPLLFIKNWATLQSTFRNSTADQATVWLWLGTLEKRMINCFLIAYKCVTGLGHLPRVLIALQSWSWDRTSGYEVRGLVCSFALRACMDTARTACLWRYYGNLMCCISTTPLLLITFFCAKHFTLFHNATWLHMKIMFSET